MSANTIPTQKSPELLPRNAAEHMDRLQGELSGDEFVAGWAQKTREGYDQNEDSVYAFYDPATQNGVFGALDGIGSHAQGELASMAARQGLHETVINEVGYSDFRDSVGVMNTIFSAMNEATIKEAKGSGTTAFIGFLHPGYESDSGKTIFDFGAAGDSIGFIVRANGTTYPLNEEETWAYTARKDKRKGTFPKELAIPESFNDILDNRLGSDIEGNDKFKGLSERHRIVVEPGDVLVLTTDGITGDDDEHRLQGGASNEDVIRDIALRKDISAREKAELLIQSATKIDDRTALVIEIGPTQQVAQVEASQVPRGWNTASKNIGGVAVVHTATETSRATDEDMSQLNSEVPVPENLPVKRNMNDILAEMSGSPVSDSRLLNNPNQQAVFRPGFLLDPEALKFGTIEPTGFIRTSVKNSVGKDEIQNWVIVRSFDFATSTESALVARVGENSNDKATQVTQLMPDKTVVLGSDAKNGKGASVGLDAHGNVVVTNLGSDGTEVIMPRGAEVTPTASTVVLQGIGRALKRKDYANSPIRYQMPAISPSKQDIDSAIAAAQYRPKNPHTRIL